MIAALVILQAAIAEVPIIDVPFDLGGLPTAHPDDIVVKGRRKDEPAAFRIPDMAPEPLLPRAEIAIGGARIGIEAQQQAMPGAVSNRAMITLKSKF